MTPYIGFGNDSLREMRAVKEGDADTLEDYLRSAGIEHYRLVRHGEEYERE